MEFGDQLLLPGIRPLGTTSVGTTNKTALILPDSQRHQVTTLQNQHILRIDW